MDAPFDPRYGAMQPRPNSDQPMGLYSALIGDQTYGPQQMPLFGVNGMDPFAGQPTPMGAGRPLSTRELRLQMIDDNDYRANQKKPLAAQRPLNRGMLETLQPTR